LHQAVDFCLHFTWGEALKIAVASTRLPLRPMPPAQDRTYPAAPRAFFNLANAFVSAFANSSVALTVFPMCTGLTVKVLVKGAVLQEYDDNEEEQCPPGTWKKYIEAQSDANFAIRITVTEALPMRKSSDRIFTDGELIRSTILTRSG
jgi:hypothetical protein